MEAFLITVLVFFTLWIIVMTVAITKANAPELRSHGYVRRRSFGSSFAAATAHELAHASSHEHWHGRAEDFDVVHDVHVTAEIDLSGGDDIEVDDSDVVESSDLCGDMDLDDTTVFAYDDASCDVDHSSADD